MIRIYIVLIIALIVAALAWAGYNFLFSTKEDISDSPSAKKGSFFTGIMHLIPTLAFLSPLWHFNPFSGILTISFLWLIGIFLTGGSKRRLISAHGANALWFQLIAFAFFTVLLFITGHTNLWFDFLGGNTGTETIGHVIANNIALEVTVGAYLILSVYATLNGWFSNKPFDYFLNNIPFVKTIKPNFLKRYNA